MIPLVLLAGFFGAGKTRFLTTVIPDLQALGLRTHVLLNDFENADIDATRLAELTSLVTPLSGECVCCSSLEELLTTLAAIPREASSVVLIEANGATKADELLGRLTTDRRLARFTLPLQVTIVDTKRWQKRWWHNGLEAAQLRTATHAQLNWTDRVTDARQTVVRDDVLAMNPGVQFITAAEFAGALQRLSVATRDRPERPPLLLPQAKQAGEHDAQAGGSAPVHVHVHEHGAHAHTHPFASVVLGLPGTVSRDAFLTFVRALPPSVVRAKGLVRFADDPSAMFVWNRIEGRRSVTLDRSMPHSASQPIALFIGVALPLAELTDRIASLT